MIVLRLILTTLLIFSFEASALSLYELGVAGGVGYVPDYPAANQGRIRTLVVPNFRYRGKIFRADQNSGVRAAIYSYKAIDFDFSFGASFPVNSASSASRKGMEHLDWLVEFGPRILTTLWHEPGTGRVRLSLPFRGVFSTDATSLTYQGTVAVPSLIVEKFSFPCDSCRTLVALGSTIASRGVGNYFYEVSAKDVTPEREEYHAQGGYLGTDLTFGMTYQEESLQIFFGGRASSYDGAANENSPLFKLKENIAAFMAVGWLFYQSEEEARDA